MFLFPQLSLRYFSTHFINIRQTIFDPVAATIQSAGFFIIFCTSVFLNFLNNSCVEFWKSHIQILLFKLWVCSKRNLFFLGNSRRISFNCRRFGTHCRFHIHRQANEGEELHSPAYEDGTENEFRNVDN